MAFGFPPGYSSTYPLQEISPEIIPALVYTAIVNLGWEVTNANQFEFKALTGMSWLTPREEIRVSIQDANLKIDSQSVGNQLYDMNRNRNNIRTLITKLETLTYHSDSKSFNQYSADFTNFLSEHNPELTEVLPREAVRKNPIRLLIPTPDFAITPILVILNILVFIAMAVTGVNLIAPDNESLILWGANFRPVTLEGEGWRLMSSVFLHIGIFHLLMNMYALVYIGLLLEPILGKTRFLSAYLMTGLLASLNSLWWHPMTISAGASGAIFGMYGVFLAMLTTRLIESSTRKALLTSIVVFVVYNLISGLQGDIDNAAHLGGLISGILMGYAFYPSLKNPEKSTWKYLTLAGLLVISISTTLLIYRTIPNVMAQYEARMNQFVTNEARAVEVFSMPEDTPRDTLLNMLKYKGLDLWEANIKLIQKTEELDLPDALRQRNQVLLRYCRLRINSYHLIYKTLAEDTDHYQDSLNLYNRKIQGIIDSLNRL